MSKQLATKVGLVSTANMLGGILNLVMVVALTRLLPKTEFATVAFIYMLFTMISSIGTLGLPSALLFFVPKLSSAASRHLSLWMSGLLFLLSLPMAGILIWLGPLLSVKFTVDGLQTLFYVVGLALVFDFPGQTFSGYLLAKERYGATALVTSLFVTARFLAFTLPAYLGWGVIGMVWGLCLTTALRAFAYLIYTFVFEQGEMSAETRKTWKLSTLFSYGIPLSLSSVVGRLNLQADKYMIAALTSAEVYAIYHVGALEVPLVATLAYSVTRALMPSLVLAHDQEETHNLLNLWHNSILKVAMIILPVFAYLMFFADPLITLIFSADYQQASVPFRVYLCLLPLRLCAYGAVLRAMGITRPVLISSVVSLCVNLLLNYPLYLWLGLSGPATASVIAQLIAILFLLQEIRQALKISWSEVFPLSQVFKGTTISLCAGLGVYLCSQQLLGQSPLTPSQELMVSGCLFLAIYLPLGWFLGFISSQDLKTCWEWISLYGLRKRFRL